MLVEEVIEVYGGPDDVELKEVMKFLTSKDVAFSYGIDPKQFILEESWCIVMPDGSRIGSLEELKAQF